MSEKPILFSTPMVKAILEGRKTQTRRVIKPQPDMDGGIIKDGILYRYLGSNELDMKNPIKSKFQPGDILWVRETWCDKDDYYFYKATYDGDLFRHWKPSIFMPREAARIFLEVKSVMVERLQDISEEYAKAEGFEFALCEYKASDCPNTDDYCTDSTGCFSAYWDSLNYKRGYSWESNPWVLVIEFTRAKVMKNREMQSIGLVGFDAEKV